MKQGVPKIDAVKIGSITVELMNPPSGKMSAKAAFVNSKTGHTHGWTTHEVWSPATLLKLRELCASMEADLAAAHFEGGSVTEPEAGIFTSTEPAPSPVGPSMGLMEHLDSSGKDAPPID